MQKYNLLFDRKYDCRNDEESYLPKFDFKSPHSLAIESVENSNFVLDIGCAGGFVAERLKSAKNCRVFGLDITSPRDETCFEGFIECNLDDGFPRQAPSNADIVLMLDVLEHLSSPENFLEELREHFKFQADVVIHASTGNIAFAITRLLHMLGMFNYGKKGILDITHKRLFTKKTFINLFEQNGYVVRVVDSVPAPWELVFGSNPFGRCLTKINTFLCRVWPSMFAYQFFLTVAIAPHLDRILQATQEASKHKSRLP
jgi:SAM-dependent methyltransferase